MDIIEYIVGEYDLEYENNEFIIKSGKHFEEIVELLSHLGVKIWLGEDLSIMLKHVPISFVFEFPSDHITIDLRPYNIYKFYTCQESTSPIKVLFNEVFIIDDFNKENILHSISRRFLGNGYTEYQVGNKTFNTLRNAKRYLKGKPEIEKHILYEDDIEHDQIAYSDITITAANIVKFVPIDVTHIFANSNIRRINLDLDYTIDMNELRKNYSLISFRSPIIPSSPLEITEIIYRNRASGKNIKSARF